MKHFIYLICFAVLSSCINVAGECNTTVYKRIFNPSNNIQLVCSFTDCGATTTPSYGAYIIESADTTLTPKSEQCIVGSGRKFSVQWRTNDSLVIYNADTVYHTAKREYFPGDGKTRVVIVYAN
jgi:hypothetical protein